MPLFPFLHNVFLREGFRYGFGFVAAWTALYVRRWKKNAREQKAQSWPSVQGRIWSGEVKPLPKTSRFLATLTYTYCVGEYESGKYFHEFLREDEADAFVRAMRDKQVIIRYREGKPSVSVLEQSVVEQTVALAPVRG